MNKIASILLIFCLFTFDLNGVPPRRNQNIVVKNRILAKVEGKPITVLDVQKKLDLVFFKQFPEYANIAEARHQFYSLNWKGVVDDLIDKELVKAEAKECKLNVTNGEVRQELEQSFGPNVILNLQKANMTYEEAFEVVRDELTIKKIIMGRAQVKALQKITPKEVRKHYETNKEKYFHPAEWTYSFISVRDPDSERGQNTAKVLHDLLKNYSGNPDAVQQAVKENPAIPEESKVAFSETYIQKKDEIGELYLPIVSQLISNQFSLPIAQQSRRDNSTVYRIFIVKDKKSDHHTPFKEVEMEIKDEMTGKAMEEETTKYLVNLRKKYRVSPKGKLQLPESFEPFVMSQ